MAESGIYEIVNLVNGKRYVGSAADSSKRFREHRRFLKLGEHPNIHLQRAWTKHGSERFEFRLIEKCPVAMLIKREQAHIDEGADYNICPTAGSTLGRATSAETRRKIGARNRGSKKPPRSAEHRAALSASSAWKDGVPDHVFEALQAGRRAKIWTEEDKGARSTGMKRAYAEGRHRRDRPPEYRQKIAETLRRRCQTPEMRKLLSNQARRAWEDKTPEERAAQMERVRAGRRRSAPPKEH